MKLVMDADCLIKLTKARLKELVCAEFDVRIPSKVRREVMANVSEHPECAVIAVNLESGALCEVPASVAGVKGEDAALIVYQRGGYAGVASDDRKFIRKLQMLGVPYITPAVFIVRLVQHGRLEIGEAFTRLEQLTPLVSDAEVAVVRLKLESFLKRGD